MFILLTVSTLLLSLVTSGFSRLSSKTSLSKWHVPQENPQLKETSSVTDTGSGAVQASAATAALTSQSTTDPPKESSSSTLHTSAGDKVLFDRQMLCLAEKACIKAFVWWWWWLWYSIGCGCGGGYGLCYCHVEWETLNILVSCSFILTESRGHRMFSWLRCCCAVCGCDSVLFSFLVSVVIAIVLCLVVTLVRVH